MLFIGTGVILVGGLLFWLVRRPRRFSYGGKDYARHSDGSFTYVDGGSISRSELPGVQDYWDSNCASSDSGSDGSDCGSDGGGGDGGGGGD